MQIDWRSVPLMADARDLVREGFVTGASGRSRASYSPQVLLPTGFAPEDRALLTDPQTSGGLLVSCTPAALNEFLTMFRRHGFDSATAIGLTI